MLSTAARDFGFKMNALDKETMLFYLYYIYTNKRKRRKWNFRWKEVDPGSAPLRTGLSIHLVYLLGLRGDDMSYDKPISGYFT